LNSPQLDIVTLGLSITSAWGNGHATTYRSLLRGLAKRGHKILFLERDVPWYSENRDLRRVPYADVQLYSSLHELQEGYRTSIQNADLVIVGSFVPEGAAVGGWVVNHARGVKAFYDIDTPVTLEKLESDDCEYLTADLIPNYDLYLSFTGGPVLKQLETGYGARMARPLYCAVDPDQYSPLANCDNRWTMAFMGTYSEERQPSLNRLLLETAQRAGDLQFAVAGSMFPPDIPWPANIEKIEHVAPGDHCAFYNSQKYTLNLTRQQMVRAGYSPSVRLFEATACGTPVISDEWPGLDTFYVPGYEILVATSTEEVLRTLRDICEPQRQAIAARARAVTLKRHTGNHRAAELEQYYLEAQAHRIAEARRQPHSPYVGE
jgi:spore maturation protein CgeB